MLCESKNRIERERQMQFGGAIRGCRSRRHLDEHGNEESLLVRRTLAGAAIEAGILQPRAPVPDAAAGGGRVAVGCDNFSSGGNPVRHFVTHCVTQSVTESVTLIVNRKRVGGFRHGAALGDCARILRR